MTRAAIVIGRGLLANRAADVALCAAYVLAWLWAISALEFWKAHRGEEILVRGPWWKFYCMRPRAWRAAEEEAEFERWFAGWREQRLHAIGKRRRERGHAQ